MTVPLFLFLSSASQNRCLICLCTGDLWDSWLVDRSRMNREIHVRICERLRGKFPWSTRLSGSEKQLFPAQSLEIGYIDLPSRSIKRALVRA